MTGADQGLVSRSAVRYFQMGLAHCQFKTSRALLGPVASDVGDDESSTSPSPRVIREQRTPVVP